MKLSLPAIKSIDFLQREGATDEENQRVFERFILDISRYHVHVALVVAGHPRLGVNVVRWLSDCPLPESIEVEIIEGISSLDTTFNDLGTNPLEKGTTLLETRQLLLSRYALEPNLETLIDHVLLINLRTTLFIPGERPISNNRNFLTFLSSPRVFTQNYSF